ncbi:MAG: hypothetical protein KatS3mg090_0081 [Patescibacteria group bacterium]|nr:MAG: hypothetical protein KatS3mg090_0081 [Patescibacteria group bacterium]
MVNKSKIKNYYREVFFLEPNDFSLPVFDWFFHKTVSILKSYTFIVFLLISSLITAGLVFVFRYWSVKLVSFLQHGV